VESRRARNRKVGEAVARGVAAGSRGAAVALRAAEPAANSAAGQAAEPLAGRDASVRAAAALLARLARVVTGDVLAERRRREARVARAAAAADAARHGAERYACAGQEEARAERADAEELEELAPGRLAGELARCDLRDVHRYWVTPAVIILYSSSFTVSTVNLGVAW